MRVIIIFMKNFCDRCSFFYEKFYVTFFDRFFLIDLNNFFKIYLLMRSLKTKNWIELWIIHYLQKHLKIISNWNELFKQWKHLKDNSDWCIRYNTIFTKQDISSQIWGIQFSVYGCSRDNKRKNYININTPLIKG